MSVRVVPPAPVSGGRVPGDARRSHRLAHHRSTVATTAGRPTGRYADRTARWLTGSVAGILALLAFWVVVTLQDGLSFAWVLSLLFVVLIAVGVARRALALQMLWGLAAGGPIVALAAMTLVYAFTGGVADAAGGVESFPRMLVVTLLGSVGAISAPAALLALLLGADAHDRAHERSRRHHPAGSTNADVELPLDAVPMFADDSPGDDVSGVA